MFQPVRGFFFPPPSQTSKLAAAGTDMWLIVSALAQSIFSTAWLAVGPTIYDDDSIWSITAIYQT